MPPLVSNSNLVSKNFQSALFFGPNWSEDSMQQVFKSMTLIKDFISTEEEESLFKEVEPHLKRQVYEKDHWDEVSNL